MILNIENIVGTIPNDNVFHLNENSSQPIIKNTLENNTGSNITWDQNRIVEQYNREIITEINLHNKYRIEENVFMEEKGWYYGTHFYYVTISGIKLVCCLNICSFFLSLKY